jgi:hypothetical protein
VRALLLFDIVNLIPYIMSDGKKIELVVQEEDIQIWTDDKDTTENESEEKDSEKKA